MAQFRLPLLMAERRPLLAAWLLFFTFAGFSALLLQWVVLPLWFPALHAGNGLLVGGDWVGFHKLAVDLSQKIHDQGWVAWELSPFGHPPAGIAAVFYTLAAPHPYVLIPLNAALHATAGVVLMQIARMLAGDDRIAFYASLPFVVFPSALAWYAQIGKDGYYFAGAFLCLYGWIVLARLPTWHSGALAVMAGLLWLGFGLLLMGTVRTYAFQLMQGMGVLFGLGLSVLFVARGAQRVLSWKKCILAIAVLFVIPLSLNFAPIETRGTSEVPRSDVAVGLSWHGSDFARDRWRPTEGLPRFIENSFLRIAVLRNGYFVTPGYDASGSMSDRNVELLSVKDFMIYLPRALQLGLFAPFPSEWTGPAHSSGGAIMRRVAGFEMSVVYVALIFVPYALWLWRRRVEFWLSVSFGGTLLLMYSYATPNIGSLHRLRYGFLMLLVTLGVAGAAVAWHKFRGFSDNSFPLKA